jgi:hypothetical protein
VSPIKVRMTWPARASWACTKSACNIREERAQFYSEYDVLTRETRFWGDQEGCWLLYKESQGSGLNLRFWFVQGVEPRTHCTMPSTILQLSLAHPIAIKGGADQGGWIVDGGPYICMAIPIPRYGVHHYHTVMAYGYILTGQYGWVANCHLYHKVK